MLRTLNFLYIELESPLVGGDFVVSAQSNDLGVGKAVIREMFTPLERSLRPKGRSFEKIQCGRGLKPLPHFLAGFTEISRPLTS